jgi:hypothetical protein
MVSRLGCCRPITEVAMNAENRDTDLNWWNEPPPMVRAFAWLRFYRQTSRRCSAVFLALLFLFAFADATAKEGDAAAPQNLIRGSWTLVFADVIHSDGSRSPDYGTKPIGSLQVDDEGHYSLLIFDSTRPRFAGNDKKTATDAEIRSAILGTSAHFGQIRVDAEQHVLDFHIEGSSYPNWEGTSQQRRFELEGDLLTYRVPARPNGDVPTTGWKRIGKFSGQP